MGFNKSKGELSTVYDDHGILNEVQFLHGIVVMTGVSTQFMI